MSFSWIRNNLLFNRFDKLHTHDVELFFNILEYESSVMEALKKTQYNGETNS